MNEPLNIQQALQQASQQDLVSLLGNLNIQRLTIDDTTRAIATELTRRAQQQIAAPAIDPIKLPKLRKLNLPTTNK